MSENIDDTIVASYGDEATCGVADISDARTDGEIGILMSDAEFNLAVPFRILRIRKWDVASSTPANL